MLVQITEENHHIYENLGQCYEAEFSAVTGKFPDAAGKFKLDTICRHPYFGFLCYEQDVPVGFVILGGKDEHYDVAEFYVIPTHRRRGIGTEMAHGAFRRYKGRWQVRQMMEADWATAFWRKAIGGYCGGDFEENVVDDEHYGKVTRQRFTT